MNESSSNFKSPFFRETNKYNVSSGSNINQSAPSLAPTNELSPLLTQSGNSRYQSRTVNPKPQHNVTKKKALLPLIFQQSISASPRANVRSDLITEQTRVPSVQLPFVKREKSKHSSPFLHRSEKKDKSHSSSYRKQFYTYIEKANVSFLWFIMFSPIIFVLFAYYLHKYYKFEEWDVSSSLSSLATPFSPNNTDVGETTPTDDNNQFTNIAFSFHSPVITERSPFLRNELFLFLQPNSSFSPSSEMPPLITDLALSTDNPLQASINLISSFPFTDPLNHTTSLIEQRNEYNTSSLYGFPSYDERTQSIMFSYPFPVLDFENSFDFQNEKSFNKHLIVSVSLPSSISNELIPLISSATLAGYSLSDNYCVISSIESIVIGFLAGCLCFHLLMKSYEKSKEYYQEFSKEFYDINPSLFGFSSFSFILPEQFYLIFMLFSLFLYSNVIGSYYIISLSYQPSLIISLSSHWLLCLTILKSFGKYGNSCYFFSLCLPFSPFVFIAAFLCSSLFDVLSFFSPGLLFSFLCFLDSLGYSSNSFEEKIKINDIIDYFEKHHRIVSIEFTNRVTSYVKNVYEVFLTKPSCFSSQFLDFILSKLLFVLFTDCMVVIYWLFKFKLWKPSLPLIIVSMLGQSSSEVILLYFCNFFLLTIFWLWILWILKVILSSCCHFLFCLSILSYLTGIC
jgi:hypothetical protein